MDDVVLINLANLQLDRFKGNHRGIDGWAPEVFGYANIELPELRASIPICEICVIRGSSIQVFGLKKDCLPSGIVVVCASRAGVAKWQTQQTQNLPPSRACGFKSLLRHHSFTGLKSEFEPFFIGPFPAYQPKSARTPMDAADIASIPA